MAAADDVYDSRVIWPFCMAAPALPITSKPSAAENAPASLNKGINFTASCSDTPEFASFWPASLSYKSDRCISSPASPNPATF